MMGTRSGSIDPSIVALLMHKLNTNADDVMKLLNKKSGLPGGRLTRGNWSGAAMMQRNSLWKCSRGASSSPWGAYLVALGDAEAIELVS